MQENGKNSSRHGSRLEAIQKRKELFEEVNDLIEHPVAAASGQRRAEARGGHRGGPGAKLVAKGDLGPAVALIKIKAGPAGLWPRGARARRRLVLRVAQGVSWQRVCPATGTARRRSALQHAERGPVAPHQRQHRLAQAPHDGRLAVTGAVVRRGDAIAAERPAHLLGQVLQRLVG